MPAKPRKRTRTNPKDVPAEIVAKVDEKVVQEAVVQINKILKETLYRAVTSVGAYVFETFFKGDPALVASKDPNKSVSFRALTEKCSGEIPISKSWLYNAVAVVVMERALPDGAAFRQLPPTHQAALLPVRNPQLAEKLAKKASDKKLSVRQLREIVGEEVAKARDDDEAPRGRPRTPTITKALVRADKVFTFDDGRRFTRAMLDELGEDEVPGAIKAAKSLVARLTTLIEKLEARA